MILEYNGKIPKIGKDVYIAPTAVVIGDVEIGDGTSIWYGTVIRGDSSYIRIGKNTNIQDNGTVHTDSGGPVVIGDAVSAGHNVVIHGCIVENRCLIGIGAVVMSRAHVKTGSVVAAGALVRHDQEVGPYHLVVGNPAVYKKTLPSTGLEIIDRPIRNYIRLAREHRHARQIDSGLT